MLTDQNERAFYSRIAVLNNLTNIVETVLGYHN